ncbi:hypothetical protein ABK040_003794 [Willaertia magna]
MDDIAHEIFKDFINNKKSIINENNTKIQFNEISYPFDTKIKIQSNIYTLGQVWYCLKYINDPYPDYLKNCKEFNIDSVNIINRNQIKNEFHIDSNFRNDIFVFISKKRNHEGLEENLNLESGEVVVLEKKLKPFMDDENNLLYKKEFTDLEKESKNEILGFIKSNILLNSNNNSINSINYLPYLEYDKYYTTSYILNKEIPFILPTKLKQESTTKESLKKNQESKQALFSSNLEIVKKCKMHEQSIKKVEERKKREKEKKEKEEFYNKASANLYSSTKGKFSEPSIWDAHLGGEGVEDLSFIDTRGSMMNIPSASSSAPSSSSNNNNTTNSSLENTNNNANTTTSSSALNNTTNENTKVNNHTKDRNIGNTTVNKKDDKKKLPIILLPPGRSSLLTLYNVKDFLQYGKFITTEDKKKENNNNVKPKEVIIRHLKTNQKYIVYDNTKYLNKNHDWDRVVAIFTIGQPWQFKDSENWFSNDPVKIFTKKKGFALLYELDNNINSNVLKWNIQQLLISKGESKRHLDATVARQFWMAIGAE